MRHSKLLVWKRNYHRLGVSHHFENRDLRPDREFRFFLYPGRVEKDKKMYKRLHSKRRLPYTPVRVQTI